MSDFDFPLTRPAAISTTVIEGVTVPTLVGSDEYVHLRRVGPDPAKYDRHGLLIASGVATTEQVPMSGLTEVFGVECMATWSDGSDAQDACALQVSVDNGATFLAWTGAAWVTQAVGGTYNDWQAANDHFAVLPLLNPRVLGFRVRLTAANNDSPRLVGLRTYLEWDYDGMIDVVQLVHDRLSLIRLPTMVQVRLAAGSDTVRPGTAATPDLTQPVRVFNLSTDPLMNTDLFDSVDGSDIVLSAAQDAGEILQIDFMVTAHMVVSRQDETLTKTVVPSIEAHIGEAKTVRGDVGRQYDFKMGDVTRLVRERQQPTMRAVPLRIDVTVAEPRAAYRAIEAIRKALSLHDDETPFLRSPASGQVAQMLEEGPGDELTSLLEGVETARWRGKILLQFPVTAYREFQGVRRVSVDVGDRGGVFETLVTHD